MTPTPRYPFYEHARADLRLPGGKSIDRLCLEGLRRGEIDPAELGIHPATLQAQARVAEQAGFTHVAENLRRAAELAVICDEKILEIYDALRPGRARPEELEIIARELEETHGAPLTAAFVREAARAVENESPR